jgi:tetratricopeptide (TPR) repeat protein
MKIPTLHQVYAPVAACTVFLLLVVSPLSYADESQEVVKLYRQGNLSQALQRADAYLASKPKDAQMRFQKGLILTEQNKTSDAILIFSSLAADHPNLPEPYNNLAVLYASQGHYEKAKNSLQQAIRTHPSYSTAHENLGDIYAKMASQAYNKALQLDKSNAAAQTKLALIKDLFADGSKGVRVAAAKLASTPPAKLPGKVTENRVEQKPAPESPTVIEKPAAEITADQTVPEEIIKTVNDWAKAWSVKDIAGYLGFYANDFQTPGGIPRADWEKSRQERIEKPKSIQVSITNPKVTIADATHARVTFKQSYHSDTLKEHTVKTLALVKAGGKWTIQQEQVGQ